MRDLIACLLNALRLALPTPRAPRPTTRHATPAAGRATVAATRPTPPPAPPARTPRAWPRPELLPHYFADRPPLLDPDGIALVRPYFVAHEQQTALARSGGIDWNTVHLTHPGNAIATAYRECA